MRVREFRNVSVLDKTTRTIVCHSYAGGVFILLSMYRIRAMNTRTLCDKCIPILKE